MITSIHQFTPETWRNEAACSGKPTDWWYPEARGGDYTYVRIAKAICADCPVQTQCLEAGIRRNEPGIWGGKSIKERRKIARTGQMTRTLVCAHCRLGFEWPIQPGGTAYCTKQCRRAAQNGRCR